MAVATGAFLIAVVGGASGSPSASAAPVSPTFTMTWSTGPLADQGGPIAESSPDVATLDSVGPAVVVGDRSGSVYAYHLADGSPVAGWPVNDGGVPIDSSPSVSTGRHGTGLGVRRRRQRR